MSNPDMCTPIACALSWPERIDAPVKKLDLAAVGTLQFEAPDSQWIFAAGAQLLISRTGGATWTRSGATSDGLFPYKISLQRADTGWTLWAIYDSASFLVNPPVHVPSRRG